MSVDTIVRNGTVVTAEHGEQRVDVLIQGGRVAGLVADGSAIPAAEVVDATGRYVLPGGIEPHVHIGIYTPSDGEWHSETCAAAQGGITTLDAHTVNSSPPVNPAARNAVGSTGRTRTQLRAELSAAGIDCPALHLHQRGGLSDLPAAGKHA